MGIFSLHKKDEREVKEEEFRQRIDEMLEKLLDENTKSQERLGEIIRGNNAEQSGYPEA